MEGTESHVESGEFSLCLSGFVFLYHTVKNFTSLKGHFSLSFPNLSSFVIFQSVQFTRRRGGRRRGEKRHYVGWTDHVLFWLLLHHQQGAPPTHNITGAKTENDYRKINLRFKVCHSRYLQCKLNLFSNIIPIFYPL